MPTSICTGEEVELRVATPGWSDGDEVVFKVYDPSQPPDSEPLAVIEAKVDGGEAKAMWRHVQELGAAAHGQYLFEAEISGKWIASPILRVDPRPVSDVRGVKERLLQLGYDCGAAGPEETPEYEKALEAFQKDLSFSQLTGRADPQTQAALTEMVG